MAQLAIRLLLSFSQLGRFNECSSLVGQLLPNHHHNRHVIQIVYLSKMLIHFSTTQLHNQFDGSRTHGAVALFLLGYRAGVGFSRWPSDGWNMPPDPLGAASAQTAAAAVRLLRHRCSSFGRHLDDERNRRSVLSQFERFDSIQEKG